MGQVGREKKKPRKLGESCASPVGKGKRGDPVGLRTQGPVYIGVIRLSAAVYSKFHPVYECLKDLKNISS
jgi:hypothetical protein